jgi:alkylated DNA repair dioxygenase AlkB
MSVHIFPSDGEEWVYSPFLVEESYFDALLKPLSKQCVVHTFKNPWTSGDYSTKRLSCVYNRVRSLVNSDAKSVGFSYAKTKTLPFKKGPPELLEIKKLLEREYRKMGSEFGRPLKGAPKGSAISTLRFDYCLVNIYRDHNDTIGMHSDTEATYTPIASVSLGCPRTFKLEGHPGSSELRLQSGDTVLMLPPMRKSKVSPSYKGCQNVYKHSIPPMTLKELVLLAEERGIPLPTGRKTKDRVAAAILDHCGKNALTRINLTFRVWE